MNKPLVVIVGETASGKSKLAMEMAKQFNGEIISADSWAIYKGMDIGTAKPSEEEQMEVTHHLINIIEPNGEYTAAVFKEDALKVIEDIHNRDKLPILVGGTGLYIDGVIYNFGFLKTGNRSSRVKYDSMTVETLVQLIDKKGYDLTAVDVHNKRRLIRVLESEGGIPTRSKLRENTIIIGTKANRTQLRKNIERRVQAMFKNGLKFEVLRIVEKYGWDSEGMQGIGYKEFREWYQGDLSMQKVKQRITRNTLILAKRQRTWFKKNRDIAWVTDAREAKSLVAIFLGD